MTEPAAVDPDTRFFVAHMQKTAGTTLRDRLRATFPEEQVYPNGEDGPDGRVSVISVSHLLECWKNRGERIRLLTGHFPVRTVELLDAPFVTVTVLRDPVERTLSFLRHQAERHQRGAGPDTPLWEIYEDPFRIELGAFHDSIVTGAPSRTTLSDSMQDLLLFKQVARHFRPA